MQEPAKLNPIHLQLTLLFSPSPRLCFLAFPLLFKSTSRTDLLLPRGSCSRYNGATKHPAAAIPWSSSSRRFFVSPPARFWSHSLLLVSPCHTFGPTTASPRLLLESQLNPVFLLQEPSPRSSRGLLFDFAPSHRSLRGRQPPSISRARPVTGFSCAVRRSTTIRSRLAKLRSFLTRIRSFLRLYVTETKVIITTILSLVESTSGSRARIENSPRTA